MVGFQVQIYNVSREFTFFLLRPQQARLILLGFVLFVLTTSVFAHDGGVFLSRSDPAINAVLPQSPQTMRLWFEDPLVPEFSRFQLRDINTRLIETPASHINPENPSELFMPLDFDLPDGLYTITYQVISAADGHEGVGSFAFIIGEPSDSYGNVLAYNETVSPLDAGTHTIYLLSLILLIGIGGYIALGAEFDLHIGRVILLGWIVFGSIQMTLLLNQILTLITPGESPSADLILRYLGSTRYGLLWSMSMAVWLGLGIFLRTRPRSWVMLGFGVVFAVLASLSSRVMAASEMIAAIAVNGLHLTSNGLWLGGLMYFLVHQLTSERKHTDIFTRLVRFSVLVLPVSAVTGMYISWLRVGSVEATTSTTYGHSLVIKLVITGLLFFLFLYLARVFKTQSSGKIRMLLLAQAVLGFGVLTITGVLVTLTPGREVIALRNVIPPVLEYETTVQELITVDGLHLQLYVTPGLVGTNKLEMLVFNSGTGDRINDVSRLTFTLSASGGQLREFEAEHQGDGLYVVSGVDLESVGLWQVQAVIQRPSQAAVNAEFLPEITEPLSSSIPILDVMPSLFERLWVMGITSILLIISGCAPLLSTMSTRNYKSWTLILLITGLLIAFVVGLLVSSLVYLVGGFAGVVWMGVLAGQMRLWRQKSENLRAIFAVMCVLVGSVILINAGLLAFAPP